jgi:hypothetical protein
MKFYLLIFLSVFVSSIAFSQEDKADYNDDYWSFGSKDVADFYISENQNETTQFKGNISVYPIPSPVAGKGKYINGKKDSIWVGFHNDGKPYFTEWYSKGKLKKGISFDAAGKQFFYKKEIIAAHPQKGWDDFVNYAQNYWNRVKNYVEEKYPENFKLLKDREIEVSFQILVSEKGIADIGEITNGAKYGFNQSAAKKMLLSYKNKWIPALFKGQLQLSSIKYTVYVKF